MSAGKQDIISFKVDSELLELLKHVDNRSQFIRNAILAALESGCPLCNGSGILQPHQRRIWEQFSASHPFEECGRCHEKIFTCDGKPVDHTCRRHRH